MELNVGDRMLVKFCEDKCVEEKVVAELYEDWVKFPCCYPNWRKIGTFEIISKLPAQPPPKRNNYAWSTENLDCPLLKKTCTRGCAWFVQGKKSCALLQLADDINTLADEARE